MELEETDPDWDSSFTEQVLQSMDAIEAARPSSTTSTPSSSSSIIKKRKLPSYSAPQYDSASGRRLPSSILAPSRSISFSLSPCRANSRMRYPALRFGGHILYSRTAEEVEKAAAELLQILEVKKRELSQITIGFDIEWRPGFGKGVLPGKAAVMQICCDISHCHVMHIFHSGIPQSLQFLLEDSSLLKVGVAVGSDAVKILKDYNVSVNAVKDLSFLANQKVGGYSKNWSLASLTEMLVCKELPKPNKIRLGNWEVDVLSKKQLEYAATDAFASWHLYQVLQSLPDSEKDAADKPKERISP